MSTANLYGNVKKNPNYSLALVFNFEIYKTLKW